MRQVDVRLSQVNEILKTRIEKMTILYKQVMLAANDYCEAQDVKSDYVVLCRYKLLLKLIEEYNATCHACNNSAPLIFDGEVGEAFSLTHGKLVGRI